MPRKKIDEDHENLERWLLTYADLITLLLAFFIVMYSMSRIDSERFNAMSEALNVILHGSPEVLKGDVSLGGEGPLKIKDLRVIKKEIAEFVKNENLDSDIEMKLNQRGLVIHITESAFFETGKADIKQQAQGILLKLSKILTKIPNDIRIEGHTDNIPINTPEFPSNWELSTARATT
ncbi:MAG: OmpA family protein, partial [candidate division Zixibacteria bacterium]|nr:OmpA family protein [candidate division Zixibacteria bacterium]